MSFLDYLNNELSNENIEHHLFLIDFNPSKKVVHAFFEGKTDESFYGTAIRNMLDDDYELKTYICGKKDSVLYHYREIGHKTSIIQPLLFFIDKDIDNIIPIDVVRAETIYETTLYAIENYIVNSTSLEQVWAEIFRQTSGTSVSLKLKELFEIAHNEYNTIALELMSWVLYQRRKGGVRLNLDCIKTTDLFSIDENLKLTKLFTKEELYNYLSVKTKVTTSPEDFLGIESCKHELSKFEIKEISRGHNEMDFFIEFVKVLKEVSSSVSAVNIKAHVEINSANVIDIMGPRIRPHDSLASFLTKHIGSIEEPMMVERRTA
ncbi:TPA: DUF4435 domain-containing protein [Photobacterium damselae]